MRTIKSIFFSCKTSTFINIQLTIVPTKMYFKKGKAKIEIAVAKGKKQYDKRATKKDRDWNRDRARYLRKSS